MSVATSYEFLDKVIAATPDGEHIRKCLQCGACTGICPYGFAMDYGPRSLIAALRADDWHGVLESDTIWLCVACFACASVCPVQIPLTRGLLATLKTEMLVGGSIPQELQTALGNSRRYGNPLGESPRKRAEWAADFKVPVPVLASHKEPVDVLWFVGDYGSYHPRVQQVSRALAKVLQALGVRFGILGPEENSDGDTQAYAGEWGLFELLAQRTSGRWRNTPSVRWSRPIPMPTTPCATSTRPWVFPGLFRTTPSSWRHGSNPSKACSKGAYPGA